MRIVKGEQDTRACVGLLKWAGDGETVLPDESSPYGAYELGILGAILAVTGILTSGPLAIPLVALVQAQPPWTSAAVFVENFHRIQTLPFYFGFLLIGGSVLMLVSICLLSTKRAAAIAGLVFMSIGAAFAVFNYAIQTTFIPTAVSNYTPELAPIVSVLSMSNPTSITWAAEMWAYGFIGMGTWCAAGFFGASNLERAGKILFIVNGVVSVLGALLVSIDLGSVFSTAGLVGYGVWNLLYLALAVVFYKTLQKRRAQSRID